MKRFYTVVTTAKEAGGHAIHLDGRPVKTPAKKPLLCPNQKLAEAVMQEWAAQGEIIAPDTMPLTQIISTKIDKVMQERPQMEAQIMKYLDTDLLCYRTTYPAIVGEMQAQNWNPVIKQFETHFNVPVQTTTGLQALKQSAGLHEAVQAYLHSLDDDAFTALQLATPLCGSVMSGILFTLRKLSPDELLSLARVEERFKEGIYDAEKYGRDPTLEKTDAAILRDLQAAAVYLDLLAAE